MVKEIGPLRGIKNRFSVQDCGYDVGIFHSSYMSTIFPKINKVANIVTVHDLILHKFKSLFTDSLKGTLHYYRRLITENFAIRNADRLIAVSHSSKNDLIDFFRISENKISVIHHGISGYWFLNQGQAYVNREPYFLFVGGRNHYKNYQTVLKSLARLDRGYRYIQLITVGDNRNSRDQEKKLYEELGIAQRVVDLGIVDDMTLKSLYQGAVAFITPSIYEGFGFPLLESLACGCPVLASDISTNREIGGQFVKLFPATNDNELTSLMINALEHPSAKSERDKAREYAKTFNWQSGARKLLDVYRAFS